MTTNNPKTFDVTLRFSVTYKSQTGMPSESIDDPTIFDLCPGHGRRGWISPASKFARVLRSGRSDFFENVELETYTCIPEFSWKLERNAGFREWENARVDDLNKRDEPGRKIDYRLSFRVELPEHSPNYQDKDFGSELSTTLKEEASTFAKAISCEDYLVEFRYSTIDEEGEEEDATPEATVTEEEDDAEELRADAEELLSILSHAAWNDEVRAHSDKPAPEAIVEVLRHIFLTAKWKKAKKQEVIDLFGVVSAVRAGQLFKEKVGRFLRSQSEVAHDEAEAVFQWHKATVVHHTEKVWEAIQCAEEVLEYEDEKTLDYEAEEALEHADVPEVSEVSEVSEPQEPQDSQEEDEYSAMECLEARFLGLSVDECAVLNSLRSDDSWGYWVSQTPLRVLDTSLHAEEDYQDCLVTIVLGLENRGLVVSSQETPTRTGDKQEDWRSYHNWECGVSLTPEGKRLVDALSSGNLFFESRGSASPDRMDVWKGVAYRPSAHGGGATKEDLQSTTSFTFEGIVNSGYEAGRAHLTLSQTVSLRSFLSRVSLVNEDPETILAVTKIHGMIGGGDEPRELAEKAEECDELLNECHAKKEDLVRSFHTELWLKGGADWLNRHNINRGHVVLDGEAGEEPTRIGFKVFVYIEDTLDGGGLRVSEVTYGFDTYLELFEYLYEEGWYPKFGSGSDVDSAERCSWGKENGPCQCWKCRAADRTEEAVSVNRDALVRLDIQEKVHKERVRAAKEQLWGPLRPVWSPKQSTDAALAASEVSEVAEVPEAQERQERQEDDAEEFEPHADDFWPVDEFSEVQGPQESQERLEERKRVRDEVLSVFQKVKEFRFEFRESPDGRVLLDEGSLYEHLQRLGFEPDTASGDPLNGLSFEVAFEVARAIHNDRKKLGSLPELPVITSNKGA